MKTKKHHLTTPSKMGPKLLTLLQLRLTLVYQFIINCFDNDISREASMNVFKSIILLIPLTALQFGCGRKIPPEEKVQKHEMGVDEIREVDHQKNVLPFNKSNKVKGRHKIFGKDEAKTGD